MFSDKNKVYWQRQNILQNIEIATLKLVLLRLCLVRVIARVQFSVFSNLKVTLAQSVRVDN